MSNAVTAVAEAIKRLIDCGEDAAARRRIEDAITTFMDPEKCALMDAEFGDGFSADCKRRLRDRIGAGQGGVRGGDNDGSDTGSTVTASDGRDCAPEDIKKENEEGGCNA